MSRFDGKPSRWHAWAFFEPVYKGIRKRLTREKRGIRNNEHLGIIKIYVRLSRYLPTLRVSALTEPDMILLFQCLEPLVEGKLHSQISEILSAIRTKKAGANA